MFYGSTKRIRWKLIGTYACWNLPGTTYIRSFSKWSSSRKNVLFNATFCILSLPDAFTRQKLNVIREQGDSTPVFAQLSLFCVKVALNTCALGHYSLIPPRSLWPFTTARHLSLDLSKTRDTMKNDCKKLQLISCLTRRVPRVFS